MTKRERRRMVRKNLTEKKENWNAQDICVYLEVENKTFYVNGKELPRPTSAQELKEMMKHLLDK